MNKPPFAEVDVLAEEAESGVLSKDEELNLSVPEAWPPDVRTAGAGDVGEVVMMAGGGSWCCFGGGTTGEAERDLTRGKKCFRRVVTEERGVWRRCGEVRRTTSAGVDEGSCCFSSSSSIGNAVGGR